MRVRHLDGASMRKFSSLSSNGYHSDCFLTFAKIFINLNLNWYSHVKKGNPNSDKALTGSCMFVIVDLKALSVAIFVIYTCLDGGFR